MQKAGANKSLVGGSTPKIDPSRINNYPLPGNMLADLEDAFKFYDKENQEVISMTHFRNILHNFGFHKMAKKEIDEELKKADPEFLKRTAVDLDSIKFVVGHRWAKHAQSDEAKECFALFDKRGKNFITASDIKQVLSSYLEFPVTEQDI